MSLLRRVVPREYLKGVTDCSKVVSCHLVEWNDRNNEQLLINCRAIIRVESVSNWRYSLVHFYPPPSSFCLSFSLAFSSCASFFHECLRMVHKLAILETRVSSPLFSYFLSPLSAPLLPLCLAFYAVLTLVFLSGRLLYIVITIFILPLLPSSLFLPSEFIKVLGVFSRN